MSSRLSALAGSWVEVRCGGCGQVAVLAAEYLLRHRGDQLLADAIGRMRCGRCRRPPTEAWLSASAHRDGTKGPGPSEWSVRLAGGVLA